MKKALFLLLSLAVVFTFSACREEPHNEGFGEGLEIEDLESDSLNVYLTIPEIWEKSASSFQGTEIRHYMSPLSASGDSFSESISVAVEKLKTDTSLEEYVSSNIDAFRMTFTDFEMMTEPTEVKMGEYDALYAVYSYSSMGYDIVIDHTFAMIDGKAYMIMCNATKDSYEEYADIFAVARESFEIK